MIRVTGSFLFFLQRQLIFYLKFNQNHYLKKNKSEKKKHIMPTFCLYKSAIAILKLSVQKKTYLFHCNAQLVVIFFGSLKKWLYHFDNKEQAICSTRKDTICKLIYKWTQRYQFHRCNFPKYKVESSGTLILRKLTMKSALEKD